MVLASGNERLHVSSPDKPLRAQLLETILEEHSTYPAILATETVPVPLAGHPPEPAVQAPAAAWPGLLLKLAALALGLLLLKHWW